MEKIKLKPFWGGLILTVMYLIGSMVNTVVFSGFGMELIYAILFSLFFICCFLHIKKVYRFAIIACFCEILYLIFMMVQAVDSYRLYLQSNGNMEIGIGNIIKRTWWYFIAIIAVVLFVCARFSRKDIIIIPGMIGFLPVIYKTLYRIFLVLYNYNFDLILSVKDPAVVYYLLVFVKYCIIIIACCKLLYNKHQQKLQKVNLFEKDAVVTEDTLEILKEKYDAGELSAEEYAAKKAEIMQNL